MAFLCYSFTLTLIFETEPFFRLRGRPGQEDRTFCLSHLNSSKSQHTGIWAAYSCWCKRCLSSESSSTPPKKIPSLTCGASAGGELICPETLKSCKWMSMLRLCVYVAPFRSVSTVWLMLWPPQPWVLSTLCCQTLSDFICCLFLDSIFVRAECDAETTSPLNYRVAFIHF